MARFMNKIALKIEEFHAYIYEFTSRARWHAGLDATATSSPNAAPKQGWHVERVMNFKIQS